MYPDGGASSGSILRPCERILAKLVEQDPWNNNFLFWIFLKLSSFLLILNMSLISNV